MWGRSEIRARWRSWIILGLLAGTTFGLAAAGWAGARRTSVALPRYLAAVHEPTAAVLANDPSFDAAERAKVAALPEVTATYPFLIGIALEPKPASLSDAIELIPTTAAAARLLSHGIIVAGRMTNPRRADEVVVDQNVRRVFHLGLGSTITLSQELSAKDAAGAPPGMVPHATDLSFTQTLHVVGISKSVDNQPSAAPSAGFYAEYRDRLAGFVNEFTTLRRGEADLPKFDNDVARIAGHPVNVESDSQLAGLPKIRNILRIEEEGLLLFALAVLAVGGVLVGQALARAVSAGGPTCRHGAPSAPTDALRYARWCSPH